MTKRDLVMRISNDLDMGQQQVLAVVQKSLDVILEAVCRGEKVELRNFGVFETRQRKARVGRNPLQPGLEVVIPARSVVRFKPGKEMRAQIDVASAPPLAADGAGVPGEPPANAGAFLVPLQITPPRVRRGKQS